MSVYKVHKILTQVHFKYIMLIVKQTLFLHCRLIRILLSCFPPKCQIHPLMTDHAFVLNSKQHLIHLLINVYHIPWKIWMTLKYPSCRYNYHMPYSIKFDRYSDFENLESSRAVLGAVEGTVDI